MATWIPPLSPHKCDCSARRRTPWNIPFLRNSYFTGRNQILQRLHQILAADETVALGQTRAISGLGGIGKTQIAIEYAYRYANEYTAVLWVRADSHEALASDFTMVATTLDLPEKEEVDQFRVITAVKRWLQEHGSWLLIFDNADDLTVVSDFLPRRTGGAILLTTRSQITGPHIKKLDIEKMNQEEGVTFLLRRITSSENGEEHLFKSVPERDLHAAQELWEIMDGLPLALDQAGAYIETRQSSLTDYLNLYRNHRQALLRERGGFIPEHPEAVTTTWSLSFQQVEQKNPAAAALLRLLAFLSPDAIPEELLTGEAAHFPSSLQILATSPLLLNDAIGTLRAYSLVRRDPAKRLLSVHRLVQAVLQDTLEETERQYWAERAMLVVNAAFPHVNYEAWSKSERLLSQALFVTQSIEPDQVRGEEVGRLLYETASYLGERARYGETEQLFQQALFIRERQMGPEHPQVAHPLYGLATLYRVQGKYGEAELLYHRALRIQEQQVEPEHPDVASSLNGLAIGYLEQGKYAQAEPLFQQALRIREQQLGPEHTNVAHPLHGLAVLYFRQGKYAQAEPLFQRALCILEQRLGEAHPETAEIIHNLAQFGETQGNNEEARAWYAKALAIREQALGRHHPKTMETRTRFIALLRAIGQHGKAAQLENEGIQPEP